MDEPASIIRRIFQMYLDGYGLKDMDNTIKKRKAEISSSIEIFNKIIDEGTMSDSDLRMMIDKIEISETDGKLDIKITFNGKFKEHILKYNDVEMLNLVS